MPRKDFEIEPSGYKGAGFEEKGYQERNLENLLDKLGSKKISEAIEDLAEIEDDEWKQLADSTRMIIDVGKQLDPGVIEQMVGTVKQYFDAKIDAMIAGWLSPYLPEIMEILNVTFQIIDGIVNSIEAFPDAVVFGLQNSAFGSLISGGQIGVGSVWGGDPSQLGGGLGTIWDEVQRLIRNRLVQATEYQNAGSPVETQQDIRGLR